MPVDKKAPMGHNKELQTVVYTERYAGRAERILSDDEMDAVTYSVASDPFAGDLIVGTGGIRKIRFGKGSRGKSGGVRVIYYYHDIYVPILLMDIYAKNEKGDLSKAERNSLQKLVAEYKKQYRRNQ
jgi:hypothetical protein